MSYKLFSDDMKYINYLIDEVQKCMYIVLLLITYRKNLIILIEINICYILYCII